MTQTGSGGLDELSRTLRQLREAAGLSGMEVGQRAGFSQAKVSRIEAGRNVPSPADVETLIRLYGAPADERRRLVELAEAVQPSRKRIVLSRHPNRAAFQKRIGHIERSSEQIRDFSPVIVPGLLQTAEYMWALWNTGGGPPEEGGRFVAERLSRQTLLDDPRPRRITILTSEGALGWAAGSAELMVRQVEHISAMTEKSAVRIGIVPFGVVASVFPVSNYSIYDERAVIPGILATQVVLTGPNDAKPYITQFERLEPMAAYGADARDILARVAERYRGVS